jgi:hypothetical protein
MALLPGQLPAGTARWQSKDGNPDADGALLSPQFWR